MDALKAENKRYNVISRSQNSHIDNVADFICLVPADVIGKAKGTRPLMLF